MNDQQAMTPPSPGFELLAQGNTFLDTVGPAWIRVEGGSATSLLDVARQHTNPNGTVHGGMLMSLMDVTLGSAVQGHLQAASPGGEGHPITMQFSCSLIGGAAAGQQVRFDAKVDRVTRTVAFVSGRATSGDRLLMTATAVFKNPSPPKSKATAAA
ncbi:PaaI family thioesterase [soil metagenome]